jgi:hypothetical protein
MKGTGPDARYYIDSEHLAAVRLLADSADETLGHQRVALVSGRFGDGWFDDVGTPGFVSRRSEHTCDDSPPPEKAAPASAPVARAGELLPGPFVDGCPSTALGRPCLR